MRPRKENKLTSLWSNNQFVVYKQPDCPKCDTLKQWLKEHDVKFIERWFDTRVQTMCVMLNFFEDPPILARNELLAGSLQLFDESTLKEDSLKEFINKSFKPRAFKSPYDTHVYCHECGIWVWKYFARERCTSCGKLFRTEPYKVPEDQRKYVDEEE